MGRKSVRNYRARASIQRRRAVMAVVTVGCLLSPQMSCSTKSTSVWHWARWKNHTGKPKNTTGPLSHCGEHNERGDPSAQGRTGFHWAVPPDPVRVGVAWISTLATAGTSASTGKTSAGSLGYRR